MPRLIDRMTEDGKAAVREVLACHIREDFDRMVKKALASNGDVYPGPFAPAADHFGLALAVAEKVKRVPRVQATILDGAAITAQSAGAFAEALEVYQHAETLAPDGDRREKMKALRDRIGRAGATRAPAESRASGSTRRARRPAALRRGRAV